MKDIVFDFGGVLVDWNPRDLYRKIFATEEEMEWFLSQVCTAQWNEQLDAGRPFEEAIVSLQEKYPAYRTQIADYYARWDEMMAGAVPGTADIVRELKDKGFRVYGLSNWSAQTFPLAQKRFPVFSWLDGRVLSGEEKINKPEAEIFRRLLARFSLKAENCIFIDDNLQNIAAARTLGFETIPFDGADSLRKALVRSGVL